MDAVWVGRIKMTNSDLWVEVVRDLDEQYVRYCLDYPKYTTARKLITRDHHDKRCLAK